MDFKLVQQVQNVVMAIEEFYAINVQMIIISIQMGHVKNAQKSLFIMIMLY